MQGTAAHVDDDSSRDLPSPPGAHAPIFTALASLNSLPGILLRSVGLLASFVRSSFADGARIALTCHTWCVPHLVFFHALPLASLRFSTGRACLSLLVCRGCLGTPALPDGNQGRRPFETEPEACCPAAAGCDVGARP